MTDITLLSSTWCSDDKKFQFSYLKPNGTVVNKCIFQIQTPTCAAVNLWWHVCSFKLVRGYFGFILITSITQQLQWLLMGIQTSYVSFVCALLRPFVTYKGQFWLSLVNSAWANLIKEGVFIIASIVFLSKLKEFLESGTLDRIRTTE